MNPAEMTLADVLVEIVRDIPPKIYYAFSTVWGWLAVALAGLCAWLDIRVDYMLYIAIAITVDGAWGLYTAITHKKFIFSVLIAKSAAKIFVYASLYIIVALMEHVVVGDPVFASSVIALILIFAEGWSVLIHVSINFPNLVAIRLIQKYFKGEMAKKLGISEDEMDDILKDKHDENK